MAEWPTRGQKSPNFWDQMLKTYIDEKAALIVVSGGSVDLPDDADDGDLIGYDVRENTIIEGTEYAPGIYEFRRHTPTYGGWRVHAIEEGEQVVPSPDAVGPVAGTLAASAITETGFTLTVTGASDAVALAPAPYSFSTDNGGSWSAYQSAAALAITGKTAATPYTCKHRVRDAAGNVTVGTGVVVTTTAPLHYPGYDVIDTFTAADGTSIDGRTTEVGGKVWDQSSVVTLGGSNTTNTISANAVRGGPTTSIRGRGLTVPVADYALKMDYDISTGTAAASERRVYFAANAVSNSSSDTMTFQLRADGNLNAYKGGIVAVTLTGTTSGWPTTGTLTLTVDTDNPSGSTTFTMTDGTRTASCVVAHGTGYTGVGRVIAFSARHDAAAVLAFGVKYL